MTKKTIITILQAISYIAAAVAGYLSNLIV